MNKTVVIPGGSICDESNKLPINSRIIQVFVGLGYPQRFSARHSVNSNDTCHLLYHKMALK